MATIAAYGCQTEIAQRIIDEGADYCLAAEAKQTTFHEGIKAFFLAHLEDDFPRIHVMKHHTRKTNHWCIDDRSYYTCNAPDDHPDRSRCESILSIGISINITQRRKGRDLAVRYYIISKLFTGEAFAGAVRGHWGIDNNCHWQLDVTFGEDQCGARKDHGDANLSTL